MCDLTNVRIYVHPDVSPVFCWVVVAIRLSTFDPLIPWPTVDQARKDLVVRRTPTVKLKMNIECPGMIFFVVP